MLDVVLYQPRIPPNTGNIIRLMANTGFNLHLIEPLGFDLEEKQLRRAGLDYHDLTRVSRHSSYAVFLAQVKPARVFAITTKGTVAYSEVAYRAGDALLFGSETQGLPSEILASLGENNCLRIPMLANNRSLNLSNAAAIVCYEAWRQLQFSGGV